MNRTLPIAFIVTLATLASAGTPKYSIQVITPVTGYSACAAFGINNAGDVIINNSINQLNARMSYSPAGEIVSLLRANGQFVTLPYPAGATSAEGWGISNSSALINAGGSHFLYDLPTQQFTAISLGGSVITGYVTNISPNGNIAGVIGKKNQWFPAAWLSGPTNPIALYPESAAPTVDYEFGTCINDNGDIVAHDEATATNQGATGFSWVATNYASGNTTYIDLVSPDGVSPSYATAINNVGMAAGTVGGYGTGQTVIWHYGASGVTSQVIWSQNGANPMISVNALNNKGQLVGGSGRSNVMADWGGGMTQGCYFYDGTALYNLNDLVASITPGYENYRLTYAWGLNDSGQIVGVLSNGTNHYGYIANPVPPSADLAVTLGDYKGDATKAPLTIEFRNPGTTTAVSTQTAYLNTSGHVVVNAPAPGTYDVTVKAFHWLKKKITNLVFTNSDTTTASTSLVNGDVDGNNVINSVDHARVAAVVGTRASASAASAAADINGDGVVNAVDIAIINTHLRQAGDN